MYIKLNNFCGRTWDYLIYTANHRSILQARTTWVNESACRRAAKKMAKKLNIEYREN